MSSTISLLNAPDDSIGSEQADAQPPQAMYIRLARDTVRDMQKSARAGRQLQLNCGPRPTLQCDEQRVPLSLTKPPFRHELYRAPTAGAGKHEQATFQGLISHRLILEQAKDTAASALAAADKLKQQMRSWQQDRDSNSSAIVNMAGKKSLTRAAFARTTVTQSMPSSPALPPSYSSQKSPMAAQNSNRAIEGSVEDAQRRAFLHCLAIEPLDLATIAKKTRIPEKTCARFVEKYCYEGPDGLLTLEKNAFKEFDVIHLRFATAEQRAKAVDNAIHALDRMRLSRDDKLWQKLLPLDERGKGKCLSRLNLHTGPGDKIPGDHRKLLAGVGGEPMARSTSSDTVPKAKKPTERELQAKRLLSKKPLSSASSAKQQGSKVASKVEEKPLPRAKPGVKRKPEPKALSAEYIEDSDVEAKEADEHRAGSRKKLKAEGGAAVAAPKLTSRPTAAPVRSGGKLARPAVPAGSPRLTATPKKSTVGAAASSPDVTPVKRRLLTNTTGLASKGSAANASELKRATSAITSTTRPVLKPLPQARKVATKASSDSLADSSTPAHRSNASVSSLASSVSQSSLKRPSSSSQDEAPSKKPRINAGRTSSSSSPFASSVSSSSSSSGVAQAKTARLPDLPPFVQNKQPGATALPLTKLGELQDLHSKVLSDYLRLRMQVDKHPSDTDLCAKLAQKSTEYDFLSNEVASLSQVPKSSLVIPATTAFPRDSSAFFLKKYNAALPAYNDLHAKLSAVESPSAAEKKQLWDLYSRLDELKRLHLAADKGEQLVKRQAVIEASINKPSEQSEEPLTRRQTLEQYRKYHQLFAAWTSFRDVQRSQPGYPHLPAATLTEDRQMYARICALQTRLVAGFERMRRAFGRAPAGAVAVADGAGPVLTAKDAELLAWKTRSRLREWGDRYDAVFSRFGDCTAEEMDALWALQKELQTDQRAVLRSLALGFGARREGKLDGLRLENVTVSLGKDVSSRASE